MEGILRSDWVHSPALKQECMKNNCKPLFPLKSPECWLSHLCCSWRLPCSFWTLCSKDRSGFHTGCQFSTNTDIIKPLILQGIEVYSDWLKQTGNLQSGYRDGWWNQGRNCGQASLETRTETGKWSWAGVAFVVIPWLYTLLSLTIASICRQTFSSSLRLCGQPWLPSFQIYVTSQFQKYESTS